MGNIQVENELGSKLILPNSEQFDEKRQIWNSAIDYKPAAIAVCDTEQDVVAAVKLAKTQNWSVAVKSGGHHLAGFAVAEGSLVVDVSNMKRI